MGLDEAEGVEVGGDYIVRGVFEVYESLVGTRLKGCYNCCRIAKDLRTNWSQD